MKGSRTAGVVAPRLRRAGCPHNVVVAGSCIGCGEECDSGNSGRTLTLERGGGASVELSARAASEEETRQLRHVARSERMNLVLDLDHTLVHTVPAGDTRLAPHAELLVWRPRDGGDEMHVYLRPWVREFIRAACRWYTLHVNTLGNAEYAGFVVASLDPDGSVFGDRVVSRSSGDGTGGEKGKHLNWASAGLAEATVILDDMAWVWGPQLEHNVLLARPFVVTPRGIGTGYAALCDAIGHDLDEAEGEPFLGHILPLLGHIHEQFMCRLSGLCAAHAAPTLAHAHVFGANVPSVLRARRMDVFRREIVALHRWPCTDDVVIRGLLGVAVRVLGLTVGAPAAPSTVVVATTPLPSRSCSDAPTVGPRWLVDCLWRLLPAVADPRVFPVSPPADDARGGGDEPGTGGCGASV